MFLEWSIELRQGELLREREREREREQAMATAGKVIKCKGPSSSTSVFRDG